MTILTILPDGTYSELIYRVGPSILAVDRRARELFNVDDSIEWRWLISGRLLRPIRVDRLPDYIRRGYRLSPKFWFDLYLNESTRTMALNVVGQVEISVESVAAVGHANGEDAKDLLNTVTVGGLRPSRTTNETTKTLVFSPVEFRELVPTRMMVLISPTFMVGESIAKDWLIQAWQGVPFVHGRPEYKAGEIDRITRLILNHTSQPLESLEKAIKSVGPWGPLPRHWRRYYREYSSELELTGELQLVDPLATIEDVDDVIRGSLNIEQIYSSRARLAVLISSTIHNLPVAVHRWLLKQAQLDYSHGVPLDSRIRSSHQINILNAIAHYDDQLGEEAVRVYRLVFGDNRLIPDGLHRVIPRTVQAVDRLVQLIGIDQAAWSNAVNWPTMVAWAGAQTRWYMYRHQLDMWFQEVHEHDLPSTVRRSLRVGPAVLSEDHHSDSPVDHQMVEFPPELGIVGALYRLANLGLVPNLVATTVPGLPTTLAHLLVPSGTKIDEARFRVVIGPFTGPIPSAILESYLAPVDQYKLYQQ